MSVARKMRAYHAALASSAILAWLTGAPGAAHLWAGYGLTLVLAFRLVWGARHFRQLGLRRFLPRLSDWSADPSSPNAAVHKLLIGSVLGLVFATCLTGLVMVHPELTAGFGADLPLWAAPRRLHLKCAALLPWAVGLHLAWVLTRRWRYARFMLFAPVKHP